MGIFDIEEPLKYSFDQTFRNESKFGLKCPLRNWYAIKKNNK